MPYTKVHEDWEDLPSTDTPVTAEALEQMEEGIADATTTAESAESSASATATALTNHLNDTSDAHDATAISTTGSHTNVQAFLDALEADIPASGGYAPGGTDVAIEDGGTGASTAENARTNLGLDIGNDVQAFSSVLEATTASFTTAKDTKLSGIETGADVTDATNVDAAGAVMNVDTTTAAMQFVVDEDTMASNSATKVPTQQSVKAYVDTEVNEAGVPVVVSLTKSATQSLPTSTFTPITFDGEEADTAGLHSTSSNTSRITMTAGYWVVAGSVEITGLSDQKQALALIHKNGSPLQGRARLTTSGAAGSVNASAAFTRIVKADVDGDYVELVGWHDQGTSLNATVNCSFGAVKQGPLV